MKMIRNYNYLRSVYKNREFALGSSMGSDSIAAGAGPDNDLGRLYRDNHRWLLALLRRKLGGDADNAADLAHDVFERILCAGSVASVREPRAYLTTVASRLTANYYRRLALERSYLQALASQPDAVQPSEEERALVVEALSSISRVLADLPARARSVFLMAQLEGMSYRDIADHMKLTLNVVQKDMVKAIAHCYQAVYA